MRRWFVDRSAGAFATRLHIGNNWPFQCSYWFAIWNCYLTDAALNVRRTGTSLADIDIRPTQNSWANHYNLKKKKNGPIFHVQIKIASFPNKINSNSVFTYHSIVKTLDISVRSTVYCAIYSVHIHSDTVVWLMLRAIVDASNLYQMWTLFSIYSHAIARICHFFWWTVPSFRQLRNIYHYNNYINHISPYIDMIINLIGPFVVTWLMSAILNLRPDRL